MQDWLEMYCKQRTYYQIGPNATSKEQFLQLNSLSYSYWTVSPSLINSPKDMASHHIASICPLSCCPLEKPLIAAAGRCMGIVSGPVVLGVSCHGPLCYWF